MNKAENNLLIAASGTGGHIFPALTIAEEISDYWKITWLGIQSRCEVDLVPKKYSLILLNFETPSKKNIFLLLQYLRIIFATQRVLKIINQRKISLIFTTGGYISAPTIIAAKISNIPIIIHESNLEPGLVTKYFGRFCDYVLTGFKDTDKYLSKCRIFYTGTPLRQQFYIYNQLPDWVPQNDAPLILVMGGSQGATGINQMLYHSIDFLLKKNIRIVHIVGLNEDIDLNIQRNKNYVRKSFISNIAAIMQNCDLVISRSGAGAINELMYTQKPSILIPFPNSKNNHQEKNAVLLASLGGAILINQKLNSSIYLKETLERIFENENSKSKFKILQDMQKNMFCLDKDNPKKKIIKVLNQFKNEF